MFAASHPAAQGTVASSPGKGGGHQTPRGPAGSSLGWIRGAQSHEPPRAHPHFPSARRMPGGPCRAASHGWGVTLAGHLDVQPGALLAELQPPGTLASPAFSKPPGEQRRAVMALGCSGAGSGGVYLLSAGLFSLPGSVRPSGSWELVNLHGARQGSLACQHRNSLHAGVQAPCLAPKSGQRVCRRVSMVGAPSQDKTGLEAWARPCPWGPVP